MLSCSNTKVFFKKAALNLAPFLVRLFDKSVSDGVFPQSFQRSYITPILKNKISTAVIPAYCPISNLTVISKLLEILILVRITKHLNNNNLSPISLPSISFSDHAHSCWLHNMCMLHDSSDLSQHTFQRSQLEHLSPLWFFPSSTTATQF